MKGPNPSVGTVPCPIDGKHTCTVHKFQPRHATDAGRRKAGKFYLKCPGHGRLGFDGDPWIQEHVLEHITWSEGSAPPDTPAKPAAPPVQGGAGKRTEGRAAVAAPAPRPAPAARPASTSSGKQTGSQAQTPPAKKPGWWEDLL